MVRWFQPQLQQGVKMRKGDVVCAVPAKSGTTWTMNIVHQLFQGGDADFEDIYAQVPWLEFMERPDQKPEELYERWDKMPSPRAFKSHSFPKGDATPGGCIDFSDDVKYIVVFRNPEEAIVSFKPFQEAHNKELFKYWDCMEMRDQLCRPTFNEFFNEVVLKGFPGMPPEAVPPGGLLTMLFFGNINGWWPYRHKKNVLMIHFSEMKSEHKAMIQKIANFLDIQPTQEQWERVLEYTSFDWMKKHQRKFEVTTLLPFKLLNEGGMVRKGKAGSAKEDGMTDEISAVIRDFAGKLVPDEEARKWLFNGGEIEPPKSSCLPCFSS